MNVYPAEHSWLVQITLPSGEWGVSQPPSNRDKAYGRLEHNKRTHPDRQHRVVKVTTVYTLEHPDPVADEDEDFSIGEVLALLATETERQRAFVEEVEHMTENVSADHEDDSK